MEERLTITDVSGLPLVAIVNRPESIEQPPCVLLLHGFTGWKEEDHYETLVKDLNSEGIATFRFDALGSGESGGTFSEHYSLSNYLSSTSTVLDYIQSDSTLDVTRLAICGHSMGGFAALHTAVKHKQPLGQCVEYSLHMGSRVCLILSQKSGRKLVGQPFPIVISQK